MQLLRRTGPSSAITALALAVLAIVISGLFWCSTSSAAETHLFNALRSLVGKCEAPEALDPIPDPECPGGSHPAPGRFDVPRSETVDQYGNIYVANTPLLEPDADANVAIFSPSGAFISELADSNGPTSVAVDSEGHLYAYERAFARVVRFDPEGPYEPESGVISYDSTPATVVATALPFNIGIAVDRSSEAGHKDRLYIDIVEHIAEYGSAAEGNSLIDGTIGEGVVQHSNFLAIDAETHDIYVAGSATDDLLSREVVKVLDGGSSGYPLIRTIDGSCLPAGHFGTNGVNPGSVAIDESTGHVFFDDRAAQSGGKAIYEFRLLPGDEEECVSTIKRSFSYAFESQIAIDNSAQSPNGGLNAVGRYLYVPSGEAQSQSHLYAFEPRALSEPPVVEASAAADVTQDEAELSAKINPSSAATHYVFEVISSAGFESSGFAGSLIAGEGDIPAGNSGVDISGAAVGLRPDTAYRFRVRASNACESVPAPECNAEMEGAFHTYPVEAPGSGCMNEALRVGRSGGLPDCRAYELVTPPSTGGAAPVDPAHGGAGFGTPTATVNGTAVSFLTRGGALPGTEAAGAFSGSVYVASRAAAGWTTESVGPSGTQSISPVPIGLSPDLSYAVAATQPPGTLPVGGAETTYVRHPDGSFHVLGEGSLGIEPKAKANLISSGASHLVFSTSALPANQLEPDAPPTGTEAIYDRTADGITRVVSLLPGDLTPASGQAAQYLGGSADGSAIAFGIGSLSPLYLRLGNLETREISGPGATFAGLAADGQDAFYVAGGDLFRYDTATDSSTQITASHDATTVNVSASGGVAYFVSPSVLTGASENPNGATAQGGEENLYLWDGAATEFVATVTPRDVEGGSSVPGVQNDGLGLWSVAMAAGITGIDPSRSSSTGATLLFESRANLASYDSNGMAEIYRFDAGEDSLECLSCNPSGAAAGSDASLQSVAKTLSEKTPASRFALIPNLRSDGKRAFFQTSDALIPSDTDGVQDVYEWEAEGVGSCARSGGCTYLISTGTSARSAYLFGASKNGDDVFISTSDLLVGSDTDETPSIYDARVEGGFAEPQSEGCEGEACRPGLTPPPLAPPPASPASGTSGNVRASHHCPKGKHRARRRGKAICVKRHSKKHHSQHHRRVAGHRGRSVK